MIKDDDDVINGIWKNDGTSRMSEPVTSPFHNKSLCSCRINLKGRWKVVDPEKGRRQYICIRCNKPIHPSS